jgi:exopolysaccharide production protein ExoY
MHLMQPIAMQEIQRRARRNRRQHIARATTRVAVLFACDLVGFLVLRQLMTVLRMAASGGGPLGAFTRDVVYRGYMGGWQFAVAVLVGLVVARNYGRGDSRRSAGRLLLGCALACALPLWSRVWVSPALALGQFVVTSVLLGGVLALLRIALDLIVARLSYGNTMGRVVLVGNGSDLAGMLQRRVFQDASGFKVVGMIRLDPSDAPSVEARLGELDTLIREEHVDTVMLCGQTTSELLLGVVKTATAAECRVLTTARTLELAGVQPAIVWRRGQPFIELRTPALRGQQLIVKRVLDLVAASVALVVLAPVMALIAVAVRLDSPGPAVFGQYRLGRYGRLFACYKFRSMYADAEERLRASPALYEQYLANDFKLPGSEDMRVTRIGRLLRKTSLDELPQLWNVVRGSMSLVGPRPIVPEEIRHYDSEEPLLLSLKPGLTGAWQVSGRSSLAYPHRAILEIDYVLNWSFGRDVAILMQTIPAVLWQRGAH